MDYINCKDAANRWGISERRVRAFCAEKKIPGAIFMGKQWMIPKTASRPIDGRTRVAKASNLYDEYIFPVPLFSSDFGHKEILGEYGEELLAVQLKYIEGDYTRGFIMAKELQAENPPEHILVGVYYIQLFFCMLLGLTEEFRWYYNRLETITNKEGLHQEDYKLAFYSMLVHLSWNEEKFMTIDPSKLSPSALLLYQMTLSIIAIGLKDQQSAIALKALEVNYCEARNSNIYPVEITIAGNLSATFTAAQNNEKAEAYAKALCDAALKYGCTAYLAKWYNHAFTYINKFFNEKKPSELTSISSLSKRNLMNALLTRTTVFGEKSIPLNNSEDLELFILISYGLSTKSIAEIKGISEEDLDAKINALCAQTGCSDRKELNNYISQIFFSQIRPKE